MDYKSFVQDIFQKAKVRNHNSVHFVNCVLHIKESGRNLNYFSMGIFNETIVDIKDEDIIPRKEFRNDAGSHYSIFIFEQTLSLESAQKYLLSYDGHRLFNPASSKAVLELVEHEFYKPSLIGEDEVSEHLNALVPAMNRSCIICEFFATEKGKTTLQMVGSESIETNKFFLNLQNAYGIDLGIYSDRHGNFMIVLPETRLHSRFYSSQEHPNKLFIETKAFGNIDINKLIMNVRSEGNAGIFDYKEVRPAQNNVIIDGFSTDGNITVEIFDTTENEIIYRTTGNLIQSINTSIGLMTGVRKVVTQDKNGKVIKTEDVDLVAQDASVSTIGKKTVRSLIYERELFQRKKKLLLEKRLFQYRLNEHENAKKDILGIINESAKEYLYFWDPYFSEKEMMEYLPFINNTSLDIRIITDFTTDHLGKQYVSERFFSEGVAKCIEDMKKAGIPRIELRYRLKKGIQFHDRFLITKDRCWMLGSSFNSIGNAHSVIVEIGYPDIIYGEFVKMWDSLEEREFSDAEKTHKTCSITAFFKRLFRGTVFDGICKNS